MTKTATKPQTGPHGIELGAFFVCSWGYDQTNVDFYKVVGFTAKCVKVQKWSKATADDDGGPTTHVVPGTKPSTWTDWSGVDQDADYWTKQEQKVERDAPIKIKKISTGYQGAPGITINSYSGATLWDGKPEYQTGGGWGH